VIFIPYEGKKEGLKQEKESLYLNT